MGEPLPEEPLRELPELIGVELAPDGGPEFELMPEDGLVVTLGSPDGPLILPGLERPEGPPVGLDTLGEPLLEPEEIEEALYGLERLEPPLELETPGGSEPELGAEKTLLGLEAPDGAEGGPLLGDEIPEDSGDE